FGVVRAAERAGHGLLARLVGLSMRLYFHDHPLVDNACAVANDEDQRIIRVARLSGLGMASRRFQPLAYGVANTRFISQCSSTAGVRDRQYPFYFQCSSNCRVGGGKDL